MILQARTLIVFTLSLAPLAQAHARVFQAGAAYNKASRLEDGLAQFSDLEQAGIERTAERQALADCASAGGYDCVLTGASLVRCNVRDVENSNLYYTQTLCEARANARSAD